MAQQQKVSNLRTSSEASHFDPTDPILRQAHPIYHNRFKMPTPSIDKMAKQVALWLRKGVTGGIITGESNFGKTRGIEYIQKIRRDIFGPQVAVIHVRIIKLPERRHIFWQYMASVFGYSVMKIRQVELNELAKAVKGILAACERDSANRVVIFLDDAQFMNSDHYHDLKPIYDTLVSEYEKKVLVVSVGEERLRDIRTDMQKDGMTVINRFLRQESAFDGIRGDEQLRSILDAYDSVLMFPVGSDTSYTESLLPIAYGNSFRLGRLATRIGGLYREMVSNSAMGDSYTMTMKTCTAFAQSLFDELAGLDNKGLEVSDEQIREALRDAIGLWSKED